MRQFCVFTFILIGTVFTQAPVQSGSVLRFNLSATVAPTCRIVEQALNPAPEGVRVRMDIDCNIRRYRLSFGEDAGRATALDTSSVTARFDEQMNAIVVDAITPGPQQISFTMPDAEGVAGIELLAGAD